MVSSNIPWHVRAFVVPAPPHQDPAGFSLEAETLMTCHKPVLGEVTRWSNDLRLKVDSNGDCFGLSWITTVLLWAVQERGRMSGLVRRLQEAGEEGGAFHRLDGDCKVGWLVGWLVVWFERLRRATIGV